MSPKTRTRSRHPQPYSFAIADSALAEAGGVPLDSLHHSVEAICRAYAAIRPVAERLGVPAPAPKLPGFAYSHVSALGAPVTFAPGSEPNVAPILGSPADIDRLREPADYLSRGVVPQRLRLLDELRTRHPEAPLMIGHLYEGPVTTAALLMGPEFFTLPYDDPARAHRLLSFCVDSAVNYAHTLLDYFGADRAPGPVLIPDDFAGMFPPPVFQEFVLPYWERLYDGMEADTRGLHSELLRVDHLPFLTRLNIAIYDPCSDQYLTPKLMRERCPVPFQSEILSWHVHDHTADGLQARYREIASYQPEVLVFSMTWLADEEKMRALLQVARELAGEV